MITRREPAWATALGLLCPLSGGGSGHEPSHGGYVGKGMLTAAVCGDICDITATLAARPLVRTARILEYAPNRARAHGREAPRRSVRCNVLSDQVAVPSVRRLGNR
jgi:hypothetical protein